MSLLSHPAGLSRPVCTGMSAPLEAHCLTFQSSTSMPIIEPGANDNQPPAAWVAWTPARGGLRRSEQRAVRRSWRGLGLASPPSSQRSLQMLRASFGEHASISALPSEKPAIRKFFREVLGATQTRESDDCDIFRLGYRLHLAIAYSPY